MADLLHGEDIAKLLRSEGPVVKCVLLRATPRDDDDDERKQSAQQQVETTTEEDDDDKEKRIAKQSHLIEEIEVDTTPKKSMVAQILGGPFTFLGQYEEEGIVLMVRRPNDDDEDDDDNNNIPPLNPHLLQPPFDETPVRGDILVMKVAPTKEVLDDDDDDADAEEEEKEAKKELEFLSHEEFFLPYSKDEYMKFAARTDIVAPQEKEDDDEEQDESEEVEADEQEGDDDDDDQDEEYNIEDEQDMDSDDEDSQVAMMNLIMGQVLRRFHEENGRGPDTRELLELRKALCVKMGIEMPEIDEQEADWDQKAIKKKREVPDDDGNDSAQEAKKVKFSQEDFENAKDDDDDDAVSTEEAVKTLETTDAVETGKV